MENYLDKDLALKIVREEFVEEFKRRQITLMERLVQFKNGHSHLRDDRLYSATGEGPFDAKGTLTHAIYERYLDMRRLRMGGFNITRYKKHKRRPIHNRPVFQILNSIAYRLNWEGADAIVNSAKSIESSSQFMQD